MTAKKKAELTLQVKGDPNNRKALLVAAATDPIVKNAVASECFARLGSEELDLTEHTNALRSQARAVQSGNLQQVEAMLVAQAGTLDAIFTNLIRRSAMNIGQYVDAADTYMRLALRAQSQCRATLETLAAIKNPPVVFAKQANIAHGHQQVNNGEHQALARVENQNPPTELLEHDDETQRLDSGTARAASPGDPQVAALAPLHGPTDAGGKSRGEP
jgi:hypothetical protein